MYDHERSLVEDYSGRPFVLLGVNTDKSMKRAKTAISKNNLNWRSWYDGSTRGPISTSFAVRSFPTILLVDHHGQIRYKNVRGERLDNAIKKLVEEAEADGVRGGAEPTREFVDISGKHKMVGNYVRYEDGKVFILKEDGEEIDVPWSRLSLKDRWHIAELRLKASDLKHLAKRGIEYEFDDPETFVDSTGKHEMTGTYIGMYNSKYIIWDPEGNEIRVTRKKLNEETRELIKQINKERRYE